MCSDFKSYIVSWFAGLLAGIGIALALYGFWGVRI